MSEKYYCRVGCTSKNCTYWPEFKGVCQDDCPNARKITSTDLFEIERLKAELSEAVEIISESCSSLHGVEFAKHCLRKNNFLSKHEKQS